jgi:hypothetical protein
MRDASIIEFGIVAKNLDNTKTPNGSEYDIWTTISPKYLLYIPSLCVNKYTGTKKVCGGNHIPAKNIINITFRARKRNLVIA